MSFHRIFLYLFETTKLLRLHKITRTISIVNGTDIWFALLKTHFDIQIHRGFRK